ncbi:hypothetical protein D4A92_06340 [Rhizobium rosettiformans]|uniref:PilZ domain-containing protein n=1 Tax=Rhizobium rosettiformans TaxID=1368430 RepID=A0ABX7ESH7_9HYPH|nr:hypothetical protein [Rhizobium rosettiformans]QRF51084.1 hypothetical protein D4A92_06340 [Rhizobium rosettiformans]
MSSDIRSEGLPHMRCEALTSNMRPTTLDCHRSHDVLLRTPGAPAHRETADDPAVVIGLALGHVRTQEGLTGTVPPRVMAHLLVHIEHGDPACEVVMDWLVKRSRNAAVQRERRKIRERPRPEPGSLRKRALRARDLSRSGLAIIAETAEVNIDE